jgi:hypothetical protein
MFDSMTLFIVLLITYAPGPGPAVGAFRGGRDPVLKPISASLLYTEVLLNASITVFFGMKVATPPIKRIVEVSGSSILPSVLWQVFQSVSITAVGDLSPLARFHPQKNFLEDHRRELSTSVVANVDYIVSCFLSAHY